MHCNPIFLENNDCGSDCGVSKELTFLFVRMLRDVRGFFKFFVANSVTMTENYDIFSHYDGQKTGRSVDSSKNKFQ